MIEWYWYVLGATLTAIIVGVVVYLLKFSKNSQALTVNKTGVSAISAVIVRDLTNKTGGFNTLELVVAPCVGSTKSARAAHLFTPRLILPRPIQPIGRFPLTRLEP